jgi:hypothetical protein
LSLFFIFADSLTSLAFMSDQKQYIGPPHFWHRYALNPRERYYYGIGGIYGPFVGPDCMYRKPSAMSPCGAVAKACPHEFPLETFVGANECPGLWKLLMLLGLLVVAARWMK